MTFIEKGLGKDSEVAFKLNIVFDECGKLMLEYFESWEIFFMFVLFLFLLDICDGFFIKKSITSALFSSICKDFDCINDVLNKVISGDFDGWDLVFFDFNCLKFIGVGLLPDLASEIASRLIVCETVSLSEDDKYSEEVHDDLKLIESNDGVRMVTIGLEDLRDGRLVLHFGYCCKECR